MFKGLNFHLSALRGLALAGAGLLSLAAVRPGAGAEGAGKPTPESAAELQKKFASERAAAAKEGLDRKFSPEWFEKADALAKQGAAALKAKRLIEARDTFRKARWHLPSPSARLPRHVARVFGDGRLRHGGPVFAVAFNKDGTRLVTAGQDAVVKVWDAG